ncbi:MAG: hypothetical protein ACSLEX_04365 [Minisyncoccota bacterium]
MTNKLLAIALCFVLAMLHTALATAADIRPFISGSGSFRVILIEGNIEPGDFETFIRIIKENQGKISGVYIFSPGGDFYEAMKIGGAMRALELSSQVPMRSQSGQPSCEDLPGIKPNDPKNCTCASAGFFIHIGAIHRGGTYLAVHRPYFAKGKYGELTQADAQKAFDALQDSARAYMQEMGVPKHIQEDVLATPSDRALMLDDKTIKTYFWLELPYRHEWKKNRCTKLSAPEAQRAEDYSRRLLIARSASDADLSKSEWNDFSTLQKKQDEERRCSIAIEQQSRLEAYVRYFGVKPNDYGEHNFAKWTDAEKYLGRRFYELLSEERFDEEKFSGLSLLKRPATSTAPAISLSDSRSTPKVVSWIGLVSTPNPSPEYTQRLVQSLESAWGKRSGGNGTTQWLWDKENFSAKLTYEPVSAEGPFLGLVIDSK